MNLVQTSATVKKILVIIGALVALYIAFIILRPIAKSVWQLAFPPKNLPNPIYGQLEQLEFVETKISNNTPRYQLNTTNGRLPTDFPESLLVYEYAEPYFSYEAGREAQDDAAQLGFTDDELTSDLRGEIYSWRSNSTSGTLSINKNTKELSLSTPMSGRALLYSAGSLTESTAIAQAKQILQSIGRFSDQLYTQGEQTVTFANIAGNNLTVAQSPFQAYLARVDFFRELNDYPILGPNPKKGLLNITVGRAAKDVDASPELLHPFIETVVWEIKPGATATYPLITIEEAWNAIANEDKGVIVSVIPQGSSVANPYTPQRVDTIFIEEIYLAYYDNTTPQRHIQPIYVFEGKYNVGNNPGGEIVVYFPAVQGQYIKQTTPEQPQNQQGLQNSTQQ